MIVDISLDKLGEAVYAGQQITGNVICTCTQETEIASVVIKFMGRAETQWDDISRSRGEQRVTTCRGRQNYFSTDFKISKGAKKIRAGRTSFGFSYAIPLEIPSSFEGSFGNIRYFVKAIVSRPETYDISKELPLLIFVKLNVYERRHLMEPFSTSVEGNGISCFCRKGPVRLHLYFPATGVMSIQELQIQCHLINDSPTSVSCVRFKLTEKTEYYTTSPYKSCHSSEETLIKCRSQSVKSYRDKSWVMHLRIPAATYTNTEHCEIIQVKHYIVATLVFPWFQKSVSSKLVPITIGCHRYRNNLRSRASFFSLSKTSVMALFGHSSRRESDTSTDQGSIHSKKVLESTPNNH